jgi:prepilin signal peptidase PulO-like enzyme (type II secretory pathway)
MPLAYSILIGLLGAVIGRLMAVTVHCLPWLLFKESVDPKNPALIFQCFFQKPECVYCERTTKGKTSDGFPCLFFDKKSGWKRFIPEMVVGSFFFLCSLYFPISLSLFFLLFTSSLLICCFFTDFLHGILPDQFTIPLIWIGLIGSLFHLFANPSESILGAVIGYGFFWSVNILFRLLRGKNGMYPGDFKLNAGIGACIGPYLLIPVTLISLTLVLIFALLTLPLKKIRKTKDLFAREIPYGCFLSAVGLIVLVILNSKV